MTPTSALTDLNIFFPMCNFVCLSVFIVRRHCTFFLIFVVNNSGQMCIVKIFLYFTHFVRYLTFLKHFLAHSSIIHFSGLTSETLPENEVKVISSVTFNGFLCLFLHFCTWTLVDIHHILSLPASF